MKKGSWLIYGLAVVALHLLGLMLLFWGTRQHAALLGMGLLAYTLGARHAFDVDHVVAIDNTVRKLIQQKENPLGVGFFFSLGHSSVVFLMTLVTIFTVHWVQRELPQLQEVGGIIGTMVSGVFLLLIGLLNLYIWFDIYKAFRKMQMGEYDGESLDKLLLSRGLISRFVGPLYRFINKSWHIYPMGFLFGLGFDTATEVAMLAMSAGAVSHVSTIGILALPVLFAAGMTLFDTTDGVLMTGAYRWAFKSPLRKVYYNLTITGISVIAALAIGLLEVMQIISNKLQLQGTVWNWTQSLDVGSIGYILVMLFLTIWLVSYCLWKVLGFDKSQEANV